jgi:hypothetical protein
MPPDEKGSVIYPSQSQDSIQGLEALLTFPYVVEYVYVIGTIERLQ